MDFPVESYSFLPGSRAILDLSYRSRLRNSNYTMSQQSRPTISMALGLSSFAPKPSSLAPGKRSIGQGLNFLAPEPIVIAPRLSPLVPAPTYSVRSLAALTNARY